MTASERREWAVQILATDRVVEREVSLGDGVIEIGRRTEGIACPDDDQMADRHARIDPTESGYMLEDLATESGVWFRVQGTDGRALENGDQIWLGAQILVIRRGGAGGEGWQIRHHGPDGHLRATHDVPADGFFIGRGSELVLDAGDGRLSRRHAQIAFVEGELRFFDRGAHNGSYVRLRKPEPIADGSEFRVAARAFRVVERIPEVDDTHEPREQPLEDPLEEATLLNLPPESSAARREPLATGAAPHEGLKEEESSEGGSGRPPGLGARLRRLGRRVAESGSREGTRTDAVREAPIAARPADAPAKQVSSELVLLVIDSDSGSVSSWKVRIGSPRQTRRLAR